jgi:hypothetical protein
VAKARDVVVRFLSETRDFLRGTDQIAAAYDEMARDADRAADAGEDAARDTARAWDRAADKMRRDVDRSSRAMRNDLADTGREAGDEFAQNLGESISSGDLSGLVSGTLGGLAGTLGKTGPIALGLAAVGGVAAGVWTAMQEGAEKSAAAAQTAFDQLRAGADNEAKLQSVLEQRFGSVVEGMERVNEYSELTGISTERIYDALVKGGPAAKRLADYAAKMNGDLIDTEGSLSPTRRLLSDMADDLRDRADEVERASAAEREFGKYLGENTRQLKKQADYYRARGSSYAGGRNPGSTYQSQVPRQAYERGDRP